MNQSQVLPGGIFIRSGPFVEPDPPSAGWPRPVGLESLLRLICGPVNFMVSSSNAGCEAWHDSLIRMDSITLPFS